MHYARIVDGRVAEIVTVPAGHQVAELYHPDIIGTLVACGGDVATGMLWDGASFVALPLPVIDRNVALLAEIASLEARSIRPLGDALMHRAAGDLAAAEAEEGRVVELRRRIADLRQGLTP